MARYLPFALAICLGALPGVASAKGDTWGLFLDLGAPADAAAFPPVAGDFAALAGHLSRMTGSPKERFVVAPAVASRAGAQETLRTFAARVRPKSLVYIYIRAYVTKPPTENAVYFYPPGASLKSPLTASPAPIRDSELAEWLSPFRSCETFLLFDLRTTVEPLGVFHGNRRLLGTYALTVIARKPLAATMAALVRRAFAAAADGDGDGALRPDELTDRFQGEVYTAGITSSDAIVALTGAPDRVLATFPAALRVESNPSGATVLLDGKPVGETPLTYTDIAVKRYAVSASLVGYRRAEPQTVDVKSVIGRGYTVSFGLEPVRIRGSVKAPSRAGDAPVVLTVRPDVGLTAPLSPTGVFEFDTKGTRFEPGKEYRVIAATVDDRFYGDAKLTFTGHDDVDVAVAMKERTTWEVGSVRFAAGYRAEALDAATRARDAVYEIPKLPEDFARYLIEEWSKETGSARAMIGCAVLSFQLGDASGSQAYWRLAKGAAAKGSPEFDYAVRGLRRFGGESSSYALAALLLALIVGSLGVVIWRHRARSARV